MRTLTCAAEVRGMELVERVESQRDAARARAERLAGELADALAREAEARRQLRCLTEAVIEALQKSGGQA